MAKSIAAVALRDRARIEAGRQQLDQAIRTFERARMLDPASVKDAQAEARTYAEKGRADRSRQVDRDARTPDTFGAKKSDLPAYWAAEEHVRRATQQVKAWNFDQARDSLLKARALDPSSVADPQKEWTRLKEEAVGHALSGLVFGVAEGAREALAFFQRTPQLVPSVPARTWNEICWTLALASKPAEALDACDRAVALSSGDSAYRDSRGVARARVGNLRGALEDFATFLEGDHSAKDKTQRQRWVDALSAGRDPFTARELEALRSGIDGL